jgi:hypothetical protein
VDLNRGQFDFLDKRDHKFSSRRWAKLVAHAAEERI